MTRYFVYDVFTDRPFAGNQLAVIPDATALPEDQLQKIAREFNFSETTFVYPPKDAAHTARVRIFTPTMEVPFAGHPTIGTALALHDEGHEGDMVLELGVGPIPCVIGSGTAAFTITAPLERFGTPDPALIAKALSLPPSAIKTDNHQPTQAGVGLDFVLVELQDQAALDAIQTDISAFRAGAARYPSGLDFAVFAYVRVDEAISARMFAPLDNIPEDPATGSACAALAAFLTELDGRSLNLRITQGVLMGRPSLIHAATVMGDPVAVTISGSAVRTMDGKLVF